MFERAPLPPADRATVPTTNPGALRASCRMSRYGRASNGRAFAARDKTTKPVTWVESWPSAPRTADVGMVTEQSDQGPYGETRGSCSCNVWGSA